MSRKRSSVTAGVFGLAALAVLLGAQAPPPAATRSEAGRDWPAYGGTVQSTRYSTLRQITRANVARPARGLAFRPT